MADKNKCEDRECKEQDCKEKKPTDPMAVVIQKRFKDQVVEKTAEVEDIVVDSLVSTELQRRAGLLKSALEKREQLSKDYRKIKPDQANYSIDQNGQKKKESEYYTEAQAAKMEKALKAINKLDRAIDKAIIDADYDELQKS